MAPDWHNRKAFAVTSLGKHRFKLQSLLKSQLAMLSGFEGRSYSLSTVSYSETHEHLVMYV